MMKTVLFLISNKVKFSFNVNLKIKAKANVLRVVILALLFTMLAVSGLDPLLASGITSALSPDVTSVLSSGRKPAASLSDKDSVSSLPTLASAGVVHAESSREYYISSYNIMVNVNPDGSADFQEYITYNFTGKFNGVLRDIILTGSGGIKDVQVAVEGSSGTVPFVQENGGIIGGSGSSSESSDSSSSGSGTGARGTYTFVIENDTAKFKVYEPSQDEKKTVVYKYRLINVVTKYNDIGEFNWKLVGSGWDVNLANVFAKVAIPSGAADGEVRIFTHGPLSSFNKITSSSTFEVTAPALFPGEFLETRVLFPAALIPDSTKTVNKNALDEIISDEAKKAEEANVLRGQAREAEKQQAIVAQKVASAGQTIILVMIIIWIFLMFFFHFKFNKEFPHRFEGKYWRELPGDYSPAEMSALLHYYNVQPRDIMATLMDLVRKRVLILKEERFQKQRFFGGMKEEENFVIYLNSEQPPNITLKSHEHFLIDWFIMKIGNGQFVILDDIKDMVRTRSAALQFKRDYDSWRKLVKNEAKTHHFFDDNVNKGKAAAIIIGVLYMFGGFFGMAMFANFLGLLLLPMGFVMLLFGSLMKRWSREGIEQKVMWQAFKRFLTDFSNLEEAKMTSVILWEHYLVYAISLGVAKEVIRQLPIVIREDDFNNNALTFMYVGALGQMNHFDRFDRMFDNTIRSVESAISTARNVASSQNSSSSGFGGGSSGGSSGGGGGGGGGAF
ncbi:MAG: DUF2207 domain-containing protein [Clostridiales bacterium]|nr:DUF2207 domain-containing protein [Clostridiales bacterium]